MSAEGMQTDPHTIDKVKNWPIPTSPEEVRSFLGFVEYYRKFVQNFSHIARPLIDVMATGKKTMGKQHSTPKWKWGNEQTVPFEVLKEKWIGTPLFYDTLISLSL